MMIKTLNDGRTRLILGFLSTSIVNLFDIVFRGYTTPKLGLIVMLILGLFVLWGHNWGRWLIVAYLVSYITVLIPKTLFILINEPSTSTVQFYIVQISAMAFYLTILGFSNDVTQFSKRCVSEFPSTGQPYEWEKNLSTGKRLILASIAITVIALLMSEVSYIWRVHQKLTMYSRLDLLQIGEYLPEISSPPFKLVSLIIIFGSLTYLGQSWARWVVVGVSFMCLSTSISQGWDDYLKWLILNPADRAGSLYFPSFDYRFALPVGSAITAAMSFGFCIVVLSFSRTARDFMEARRARGDDLARKWDNLLDSQPFPSVASAPPPPQNRTTGSRRQF